jgi:tetratricopeptide (TPR) repeat protein
MTFMRARWLGAAAVIISAVTPILFAQSAPRARPTMSANRTGQTSAVIVVARCVEQLDAAACQRALKLGLSAKEKSQVLTYKYVGLQEPNSKLLDTAIALDPQNALAHFLHNSLESLLKAIELNPEWKRYYVEAALLGASDPKYASTDDGLKLWQLALQDAPDDPRVYSGYAKALKARGRTADAEAILKCGVAANPSDADSARELCELHIKAKDFSKLRPACQQAIRVADRSVDMLAWELEEVKEYALAEKAYRVWLERYDDGQRYVRYLNLANVLRQEGKLAETAAIERTYLARHPEQSIHRDFYASVLEEMGNIAAAEEQYELAAKNGSDCGANSQLGQFYLRQKRYDEAFKRFEKSYEGQLDCPPTTYILAYDSQAFGSTRNRIPAFETAMLSRARPKDEEKSAQVWYGYGSMAREFGRFDEALIGYRRAAELSPNEAFRFGALGWAYYDLRRYREAIDAFEEAEKRQPGYLKDTPEVWKRYQESLARRK